MSFSSHPLIASPYLLIPSSSVHPSLSPGLASVGRFQSVCSLMTPLGADVMLSSCCSALQPPDLRLPISLSASPPMCLIFLFIYVFLFPAVQFLNSKLVFHIILRSLLSSMTSLTNLFQFSATLTQLFMFKAYSNIYVITISLESLCFCQSHEHQLSHCNLVYQIMATDGSFSEDRGRFLFLY